VAIGPDLAHGNRAVAAPKTSPKPKDPAILAGLRRHF